MAAKYCRTATHFDDLQIQTVNKRVISSDGNKTKMLRPRPKLKDQDQLVIVIHTAGRV